VFLGFSYGFRPERRVHDALDAIWVGITRRKVNWILDADVRNFFGELDHTWLLKFLGHRVGDPRILRLIKNMVKGVRRAHAGMLAGNEFLEDSPD
jgi:RNA-directed DNA polymerase